MALLDINKIKDSSLTGLRNSLAGDSDDLDNVLDILTSENYSRLYSTYNKALSEIQEEPGTVDAGSSASFTGDGYFAAWDPRLARIDGFTADKSGNMKAFVPFASATAAGAFYDLVFTIEKKIDDEAIK